MSEAITELSDIEGVEGIIRISRSGEILERVFTPVLDSVVDGKDWMETVGADSGWESIATSFSGIQEAEILFEQRRILLRTFGSDYLLVIMENTASSEMVRLSVDTLILSEESQKKPKGLSRLFRLGA